MCPRISYSQRMTRPPISEGTFLYVLGIVVIATQPSRFWLGFVLAATPVLIGALGKAFLGSRWDRL